MSESENKFTVTLQQIIDELKLETDYLPKPAEEVLISENEINRPGIQLMNFYEYFNPERIQILGKTEFAYLSSIGEENRTEIIRTLFKKKIPLSSKCVFFGVSYPLPENFFRFVALPIFSSGQFPVF